MLRSGASHTPGQAAREAARGAAQQVWDVAATGLGPWGAWKLADERIVRASTALRELPPHPAIAPYQRLVAHVAAVGGHSLLGAALAARLVQRVLDAPGRLPQRMQGLVLARRQALSWLQAHAEAASPERALAGVAGAAAGVLHGVRVGDFDAIDVRNADVPQPTWSDGLVIDPKQVPRHGHVEGAVLLVGELLPPPRVPASLRVRSPGALAATHEREEQRLRELRSALAGIAIVLCRKGTAEELGDRWLVVSDAPESLMRRAAWATGATPVPDPQQATAADLGQGVARRRRHDWLLSGTGPSGTLEVPGHGPWASVAVDEAETWLRALAPVLDDSRVLPGGGAWQRAAADALQGVADHAGSAALGVRAAAAALDDVAAALVRNAGQDPTRVGSIEGVDDAYAAVQPALAGAFDVAIQVLRIDGAFSKRPSQPADLRGSMRPSGSPKGMPGDVPPLM